MERSCNFCSGSSNFRKDKVLENLYRAVKVDKESIPALVSSNPCSALKMIIAFHDRDITEEFVSQYTGKEAFLTDCPMREQLSREVLGIRGDLGSILTLGRFAQILSASLEYEGSNGLGIKRMEEVIPKNTELSYDATSFQGICLAGRFSYLYQEETSHPFQISKSP